MKNVTLALVIALGFCATEAGAQTLRGRRANQRQRAADEEKMTQEERELCLTWPNDVCWDNANIVKLCAEKLNVVLLGWESSGGFGGKIVCYGGSDGGWTNGCGKCIIDSGEGGEFWKKFDSNGVLIQAGNRECFAEYIWMTNRAECATVENRKKEMG